jgi:hypothetical protein
VNRRSFLLRSLVFGLLLLPIALPSHGQVGGTTVVVHVASASGRDVPTADVTARCVAGPEWRARLDQRGYAVLVGMPPCALSVSVEAHGVTTVTSDPIPLGGGETVVFRLMDWEPIPTDDSSQEGHFVVDRASIRPVSRFGGDEQLRDLPSSRNLWSLLETVEAAAIVDRMDGAGLYLGEPGRLSMRGASWTQNAVVLDGLDVTDRRRGTPLTYPDVDALDAIDVVSAMAPVEWGAPGVTLSLVGREPAREWSGTAQASGLSARLQANEHSGQPPSIARFGSLAEASVLATGPVHRERLRVLLSAHFARLRRLERDDPNELESRLGSVVGHVAYQPSARDALRLVGSAETIKRPFPGRVLYSGGPVYERVGSSGASLRWQRTGESTIWSALAGLQRSVFEAETAGREIDRPVDRVLDGAVPELIFPTESVSTTWTAGANVAWRGRKLSGLWHAPRLGVTLGGASATDRPHADGAVAEQVDGLAARVWEYTWAGTESRRHTRDLAAFVADRIVFRDRIFLEAGLRLDAARGRAEGVMQDVSWTTVSPRISARARLTDAGRFSVLGGYGEYGHRLLLSHLSFGDPAGPQAAVSTWTDVNGDGRYQPSERGALVARAGPGAADGTLASVDPKLRPPRTREFMLGFEAALGRHWTVSLIGFDRRERNLIESVNVGVPPSSYTVRYLPDPSGDIYGAQDDQMLPVYDRKLESFGLDRYVLTNPPELTGLHQAAELRVEHRYGSRLFLLLGATASLTETSGGNRGFRVTENDQGLVGELFDDPNADTHAKGRSFFDRAFTLKIATAYRAPGDLRFGVVARYQDGQPFGRLVVVPDLAQGVEAIPATPRGQIARGWAMDSQGRYIVPSGHRFTFELTVDARLEKGLRWGTRRLALVAEAFNLLGTRHEVEEDATWGPTFREPTALQPPRTLRMGVRMDF